MFNEVIKLCYNGIYLKIGGIQMAVRHINQNAKEESGIFLSGDDAKKVFSIFSDTQDKKHIKEKQEKLNSLLTKSIKIATS